MADQQKKPVANAKTRPKKKAAVKVATASQQFDELALLPGLDATVAGFLWPRIAWAGAVPADQPRASSTPVAAPATGAVSRRTLPLQSATVDRSVPNPVFSRDIPVKNKAGKVVQILRRPLGYPSGGLPADPAEFPPGVDPRTAMCHILAPGAASRCSHGRGYF